MTADAWPWRRLAWPPQPGRPGWLGPWLASWLRAGLLTLLLGSGPAQAHKPSDSYLALDWNGHRIEARWDIALRDLETAIGLDADGDGRITWGELRSRHDDIAAYALARIELLADGLACTAAAGEQLVDEHADGAYTVLPIVFDCPHEPRTLSVGYRLFAELDPTHRGLLRLTRAGATTTAVLDPNRPAAGFGGSRSGSPFAQFLREGVWHIWIGLDHVLFLLSLLLPTVLVRQAGAWQPAPALGGVLIDVAKVVTAFTVAHSITLTLATLGVVSLPSALVESVIAASVFLVALANLLPGLHVGRWQTAFAFGLVHGFGFATVLAGLELPTGALLQALFAFNVGVELGQLAIVAVFLPMAFAARGTRLYRQAVLAGGSVAIATLAAIWFTERAFSVSLLGL